MKQEANNASTPLVSVIIPAHNEEQYIGRTLQSLREQSYPKDLMEVIVVDNNSTDGTSEVAGSYDIKLLHKPDGLVGAVRNEGFRISCGEIIAFLDADCIVPVDWVKEGVSLITSNPGHTFGGFCVTQENPSFIEKYWLLPSKAPQKELLGASIFINRKDFIAAGQFDENVSSGEDSKLSLSLKRTGIKVKLSDKISVIHLGNPVTFKRFLTRQIWHSENYFRDLKESIKDPVFYLALFWTITVITLLYTVTFHGNTAAILTEAIIIIAIPGILSLKRIKRSTAPLSHMPKFHKIYILDFLYILGRSIGLTKGILYSLFNKNNPV